MLPERNLQHSPALPGGVTSHLEASSVEHIERPVHCTRQCDLQGLIALASYVLWWHQEVRQARSNHLMAQIFTHAYEHTQPSSTIRSSHAEAQMVGSEWWPGVRFILIHRTSKACVRQTTSRSHPECTSTCSCSFEHHNCRQRRRARRHSGAAPARRRRCLQRSTLRSFSCSDSKRPLGGDETTLARPQHTSRTTQWWQPQRLPKQRARNRCHTWKDRASTSCEQTNSAGDPP